MSYILEALKKSEQSRGHGTAPGIQTVHSSSLNYRPAARSIWPWILIAAVLLNLAVLLYFVFQKNTAEPISAPTAEEQAKNTLATGTIQPAPQAIPQAAPATASRAPAQTEPASAPEPEPAETSAEKQTQSQETATTDLYQAVDINQLPEAIRDQIPPMTFTAHVYSSDPKQRSVVINGHYMEEGESLDDDFVLKEITSNGVIMDFRGHLFRTNVISGW